MVRKSLKTQPAGAAKAREARLKAALKANLGKRKAQAKVRGAKADEAGAGEKSES